MQSFFDGIYHFIAGFSLIFKSGIKRYVVIPLLINGLVFIGLFFLFRHYVNALNHWFAMYLPAWLQWLSTIFWLLFLVSFLLFCIATFVAFANALSAPFNSLLSEAVENYLSGKAIPQRSLFENIKDIPRIFARQFAVLAYYGLYGICVLILFVIPLTQPIAAFCWFLFNAWFMTLTYLDYPSDNHRMAFSEMRGLLRKHRLKGLGFGCSILLAAMIPLLNLFVMPAAVAGATRFWLFASFPKK